MNYNTLNFLFYRIDKSRKIKNIIYKNSLAWIIVREAIFNSLINSKKKENRSHFFDIFFAIRGAIEFLINYLFCEIKDLGLFYSDRTLKIKDKFIHPHVGNIKKIENKKKIFHFYYPSKNTFGFGRINNFFFDKFISLVIKFKSTNLEIILVQKNLTSILKKYFPDIDEKKISNIIRRELKRFSIKTFLFNKLFKSLSLKKMIITDADAKVAEIYVCKLLNIEVIEIQHGVIFKNESGYTWDKSYKNYKNIILPIPDEIIVFGKFWKRQILENGYFLSKNIIISTNVIIKMYNKLSKKDNKDFKMLLISQDYVRKELIKIIDDFLKNLDHNFKRKIKVSIKLHPNEFHNSAFEDYKILVTKYPHFVEILHKRINVYDQISKSDIVMGHTSFLLFESIGIGIPALVLGNKNKNSILDIYDKKIIENFELVNTGNELSRYITKSKKTKPSSYFSLEQKLTEDLISSK